MQKKRVNKLEESWCYQINTLLDKTHGKKTSYREN